MKSSLKKLVAMGKLITAGFMNYYACDNEALKECVLNEKQVDGIDQIKTEMKMFRKQREVAFNDLVNENEKEVRSSLNIFEQDIKHLTKFLQLCRKGKNEIEKALFEPLSEYVDVLKETVERFAEYDRRKNI